MNNFRKLVLSIIFLSIFEKINSGDEPKKATQSLEDRIKNLENNLFEQNKINTFLITIITQQHKDIKGLMKDTEGLAKVSVAFYDDIEYLLSKDLLVADKSKKD